MLDRRLLLGGMAALGAGGAAAKDAPKPEILNPGPSVFANGPLADNPLAVRFVAPEAGLKWPSCRLIGPKTWGRIEDYRGKVLLVTLWAEWCTPCLTELPGIAYHCAHSNNDRFAILPILTASHAFTRVGEAQTFLTKIGVKDLPTLIDGSSDGDTLMSALCRIPTAPKSKPASSLPCALIIDADGVIRAKSIGGETQVLADGKRWNLWATTKAVEFVTALSSGKLPLG